MKLGRGKDEREKKRNKIVWLITIRQGIVIRKKELRVKDNNPSKEKKIPRKK